MRCVLQLVRLATKQISRPVSPSQDGRVDHRIHLARWGMMVGLPRQTGEPLITTQHGPQPADFADVRATNLAVVLRHVRDHAPCSRADIAAVTGLNKATVSSLVADLIERRLVRESGLTERRIGRPATMLMLDGTSHAGLGVTLGAGQVTAVGLDLSGEQVLSWRRATHAGGSAPA